MTRIDGNQGTPVSTLVDRTEAARTSERAQEKARAAQADRVELSSEAALVSEAVQAARDAAEVRSDKVAAARQALANGTLGADADALADALLDHMADEGK